MTALRLIVFDVDGTLVDSQAHIVGSMLTAFEVVGHPAPTREEVLSIIGLSLPEAIHRLAPHLPEADQARIVETYKDQYVAQRHQHGEAKASPLYPGVREMLDQTAARPETILGVATGKSRRGLDFVLGTHGLTGFFATEQVADFHPSKPHPSMLHAALEETGTEARQAVMIGDTSFDMQMGRAAGFATIGVTWGYHPVDHLKQAGAQIVVETMDELSACLYEWGELR